MLHIHMQKVCIFLFRLSLMVLNLTSNPLLLSTDMKIVLHNFVSLQLKLKNMEHVRQMFPYVNKFY